MEVKPLKVKYFEAEDGACPYLEWFSRLKDRPTRAIIQSRLTRVRSGQLGDYRHLENGDGVCELKFRRGGGLRIYFGRLGQEIVLLLCGGDKGSQNGDIAKAKKFWKEARRLYA